MVDIGEKLKGLIAEGVGNIDKKVIIVGAAVVFLVGCGVTWYLLSGRGVSDNRGSADRTASDLARVGAEQQAVANGLSTIESGLADSQKSVTIISAGIGTAQTAVDSVASRIDDDEAIVERSADGFERCEQILAAVRARGPIRAKQAQN